DGGDLAGHPTHPDRTHHTCVALLPAEGGLCDVNHPLREGEHHLHGGPEDITNIARHSTQWLLIEFRTSPNSHERLLRQDRVAVVTEHVLPIFHGGPRDHLRGDGSGVLLPV